MELQDESGDQIGCMSELVENPIAVSDVVGFAKGSLHLRIDVCLRARDAPDHVADIVGHQQ